MRHLVNALLGALALASATDCAAVDRRDGSHDFDFDLGRWKLHSRRLDHPLTGSTHRVEMEGTTVARSILNGRGNVAEVELAGAEGPLELIALRRYDEKAGQWTIDFATPDSGTLGPPSIGEFRQGRGDFFSQESIGGHAILVRFSIWPVSADVAESEQAFSADGGQTWELNWQSHYTRIPE